MGAYHFFHDSIGADNAWTRADLLEDDESDSCRHLGRCHSRFITASRLARVQFQRNRSSHLSRHLSPHDGSNHFLDYQCAYLQLQNTINDGDRSKTCSGRTSQDSWISVSDYYFDTRFWRISYYCAVSLKTIRLCSPS